MREEKKEEEEGEKRKGQEGRGIAGGRNL